MQAIFRKLPFSSIPLFVFSAFAQTLCATYFLSIKCFAPVASLLFMACQLLSCVCILHLPTITINRTTFFNKQTLPKLLTLAALLPVSYVFARRIMDGTPLQIEYADMLPIIGVMCHRFLSGEITQVYAPIPQIWNGVSPIYLPAMWLPFCASFLFHFDMRWTTVACLWLCVLLCVVPHWRRVKLVPVYVISLLLLLTWLHTEKSNNVIRLTEEGVVYFYYALLALALLWGRAWAIGIAAAFCLLSRYALIGWIPFAALYLAYQKQYRFLVETLVAGGLTAALLLLPFGTIALQRQWQLPQQYIAHAQRVWQENPEFFQGSLGLAKFFGPAHADLLHHILVWGSFVVPLLFFLSIYKKPFRTTNVLLAGLQVSLCFFYAFVDVSYLYLFYTPVVFSLVVAGWAMTCSK